MTSIDLMLLGGVAIVAGVLGQLTAGFSKGGWFVQIGMAFFGATLAVWGVRSFNLPIILPLIVSGKTFPVLYAVIGAAFGVAFAGLFTRTRW